MQKICYVCTLSSKSPYNNQLRREKFKEKKKSSKMGKRHSDNNKKKQVEKSYVRQLNNDQ